MKHWRLQHNLLGSLSVTVLSREIIIIYRRNKNTIIKNYHFHDIRKTALRCAAVIAGGLLLFGTISFKDAILSRDEWSNEIEEKDIADVEYEEPINKPTLKIIYHTVKAGETISEIARMYGISMDTIIGSNQMDSYDVVQVGRVLKIPNKEGVLVHMQRGQSLPALARKYNVAINKIIAENSLVNPDFVNVGDKILIPDAKPLNIFKGFLWPVQRRIITSGYGWRKDPFFGGNEFHKGIDIRANYEWVRASKYGRVSFTGWLGGYGNTVVVTHPGGYRTLYGHLSRITVRRGQHVKQGQIIARSGNTGNSTGPHLHFEIMRHGRHLNPFVELRKKR